MKFSKNWIQEYVVEKLPQDKVIEDILNAKAFEVEGIEKIEKENNADSIFDIKVLPNRSHDALGHVGMAREIVACLDLTFKKDYLNKIEELKNKLQEKKIGNISSGNDKVFIEVKDNKACSRFMTLKISGVKVGPTPEFIKTALNNIGQKSINNIVDITNYVQFMLNKPMHAYDAYNIVGGIIVRYANEGEVLTTLDNKEIILNEKTLVIADNQKALGLAGIKGGKYSGVNENTKSIIIESANFDPVLIRKTSQKYNIKTDASKRFENGICDELVSEGLYYTAKLILDYCLDQDSVKNSTFTISDITNIYKNADKKNPKYFVGVTAQEINSVLGSSFESAEIENSFKRLDFDFEKINTEKYIKENYEKLIDVPYKNPASQREDAPELFSCSSLVSYLFKGVWMPSLSIDKYVYGKKINKEDLVFGDLVFANSDEGKIRYESVDFLRGTKVDAGIDHVGIYVGDDKVLHATKKQGKVVLESMQDFENDRKITGYARVSEDLNAERYVVYVPFERSDIRIKEDLIEEVGRIIGFEKLTPTLPNLKNKIGLVNKKLYYQNIIRNILLAKGFSEVMNYAMCKAGEVKLLKAASNKNKMRTNLSDGLLESVNKNITNMPLLNIDIVKVFEFGNVWNGDLEYNALSIGMCDGKKKSNYGENVDMILGDIKRALGLSALEFEKKNTKPYIVEINFDKTIEGLLDNNSNEFENILSQNTEKNIFINTEYINKKSGAEKYKAYSQYPFVVRDVSFWIDKNSDLLPEIEKLIKENAGDLCISINIFDQFEKDFDGVIKKSLGYRLVYQSFEKTLTDEEVNVQSDNVYSKLKELGLEVR